MRTKPSTTPLRAAVAGAAATALTATALAVPAQADPNPYSPGQVCGAGFGVIDEHPLRTGGTQLGMAYLLYNVASGKNCVAVIKHKGVGTKTPMGTFLQRRGGKLKIDRGRFAYYAGPKTVKAAGKCVRWGGGLRVGKKAAFYLSTFEHCR